MAPFLFLGNMKVPRVVFQSEPVANVSSQSFFHVCTQLMLVPQMMSLIFHGPSLLDEDNKGLGRTSKAVLWGIQEVEWGGVALAGMMVRL